MNAKITLIIISLSFVFVSCFREKTCVCETIDYIDDKEVSRDSMKHTTRLKALCVELEQTSESGSYKSVTKCSID